MQSFTVDSIGNLKICQPLKGYRFSVDSIILANFINLKKLNSVVDLGAGTGIIGIIIAKRYVESKVKLIEIQGELARLAKKNIELNKLTDRVEILCIDGKNFMGKDYDLIVTNPPFRRIGTGRISPKGEKAIARHEFNLSIEDIAKVAEKSLKHKGRLCLIHLPERLIDIVRIFTRYSLEIKYLRFVHSTIGAEAKMVLIEAVKGGKPYLKVAPPLFIYKDVNEYSDEMKQIYKNLESL